MMKRMILFVPLVIGILVIVSIAGCVAPAPPPTAPPPPTPLPGCPEIPEQGERDVTDIFREEEVLIVGHAGAIEEVLNDRCLERFELKPLDEPLILAEIAPLPEECLLDIDPDAGAEFIQLGDPDYYTDLVIGRYQIQSGNATLDAVSTIREIGASDVSADPVYLTGDPWTVGGSTVSMQWSPATEAAFADQWAFGPEGIDMRTDMEYEGREVLVGIFDTDPEGYDGDRDSTQTTFDHGLSVESLVQAVAPSATTTLYRVLDENAEGDIAVLYTALADFIGHAAKGNGAVINLSLGLHYQPGPGEPSIPEDVKSLQDILGFANCHGIIITAAAGNDSAEQLPPDFPLEAQIPASYPFVIGVAASGLDSERACYSNRGPSEIMASGGGPTVHEDACVPLLDQCAPDDNMCPYSVIAKAIPRVGFEGYSYTHRVGTSFATPLVSGLAARLLEAQNRSELNRSVAEALSCGAMHSGSLEVVTMDQIMGSCFP